MLEWLKRHAWKACKPLKGFVGSNPILSADSFTEEISDARLCMAKPGVLVPSGWRPQRPATRGRQPATPLRPARQKGGDKKPWPSGSLPVATPRPAHARAPKMPPVARRHSPAPTGIRRGATGIGRGKTGLRPGTTQPGGQGGRSHKPAAATGPRKKATKKIPATPDGQSVMFTFA